MILLFDNVKPLEAGSRKKKDDISLIRVKLEEIVMCLYIV